MPLWMAASIRGACRFPTSDCEKSYVTVVQTSALYGAAPTAVMTSVYLALPQALSVGCPSL